MHEQFSTYRPIPVQFRRELRPGEADAVKRATQRAELHGLSARRLRTTIPNQQCWFVQSHSNLTIAHEVIIDTVDDRLLITCDCRGWQFDLVCHHVGITLKTAQLGPFATVADELVTA